MSKYSITLINLFMVPLKKTIKKSPNKRHSSINKS